MSKGNLAYDLSRYENAVPEPTHNEEEKQQKTKIRIRKVESASSGSAPKIIILTGVVAVMLIAVIYGKVENAAIHAEINAQTKYVDTLRSENVRMQTAIEGKSALKTVEQYATEVLGMQKLDKSQIEYLSLENGNVIDIPQQKENIFVKIKNGFSDFLEYIRG